MSKKHRIIDGTDLKKIWHYCLDQSIQLYIAKNGKPCSYYIKKEELNPEQLVYVESLTGVLVEFYDE